MKKIMIFLSLLLFVTNIYSDEVKLFAAKNWDGTFCYINEKGEVVIEGEITEAEDFSEGLARVRIDNEYVFIDHTGKVVIKSPEEDTKGKIHFRIIGSFHDGLALCELNNYEMNIGGYGYIDKTGKPVITKYADFDNELHNCNLTDFSEGFAIINVSDKYGYINTKGEVIFPLKLKKAFPFSNGMAKVLYPNKDLYGYIDTTGKIVIKPRFVFGKAFSEGLAIAQDYVDGKGKNVIINKTGEVVADLGTGLNIYASSLFNDGIATVEVFVGRERSTRIIDKNGNTIKQFEMGTILSDFSEGHAFAYNYGCLGIVDMSGEYTYKNYKFIESYGGVNLPRPVEDFKPDSGFKNGLAKIKKNHMLGYIDYTGNIIYLEN